MKKVIIFLFIIFMSACRKEKPKEQANSFKPDFLDWKYTCHVNINGTDVLKYIKAIKFKCDSANVDSSIEIYMKSSDQDYNYYYPINMGIASSIESGTYQLYNGNNYCTRNTLDYSKICCYSNPDVIYAWFHIDEADTINNNYICVHIDSLAHSVSKTFKATLVIDSLLAANNNGPDTIKMLCDTFFCKY